MTGHKKKLIEVALPLDAINKASASKRSICNGLPSVLPPLKARRLFLAGPSPRELPGTATLWPELGRLAQMELPR